MTVPLVLASLFLVERTSRLMFNNFSHYEDGKLAKRLADVRALYEIKNVQNKVVDGREPFPENKQSLRSGISVEFRLIYICCSIHAFLRHVCQACFVPVPWCREVCSPRCIVQNRSRSTLCKQP
jgi:hypothetical protein